MFLGIPGQVGPAGVPGKFVMKRALKGGGFSNLIFQVFLALTDATEQTVFLVSSVWLVTLDPEGKKVLCRSR